TASAGAKQRKPKNNARLSPRPLRRIVSHCPIRLYLDTVASKRRYLSLIPLGVPRADPTHLILFLFSHLQIALSTLCFFFPIAVEIWNSLDGSLRERPNEQFAEELPDHIS
ncbi:hypothetical protein KFY46_25870, partial [Salmonella enterica subsp. enterica serovar 1,4,[5],12:i:-]|nr:hypothetical protein [Salmonella enterica subsp. enterica serovar 1,4,[5],12:i:-]